MSATDIEIINAALTVTGHEAITGLDDGSAEAIVASANYEDVVAAELAKYPWSFARQYEELDLLQVTPDNGWEYAFSSPSDMLKLINVEVDGYPIEYRRRGARIYTNQNEDVFADYAARVAEDEWPHDFKKGIITRMEAVFLRGLDEKDAEAEARDSRADFELIQARNEDAKNQTPRDRRSSRLVNIRRG